MNLTRENQSNSTCTHDRPGLPCFIPAQRVLNLISKKWCIQLIHILRDGKSKRYIDLKEMLHRGWKKDKISDSTLSTRLLELTKEGILIREVYPEIPPKVDYRLSDKGESLSKALKHLIDWTVETCHRDISND